MTARARLAAEPAREFRPRSRARLTWGMVAVAIGLLYFAYWRLSWTAAANSDSAATALQAWDVLHGNVLLRGWWMSDVSFYTTEVPQYLLVELFTGLGTAVVHVAAAMTNVLIVVLVALVAAGPAGAGPAGQCSPAERWTRALLAATISMSPQVSGALILLLGPDHTGTVVPVLATWLVIDRLTGRAVQPGPWRWALPVLAGAMLTWIMVADAVVLFTGILPLVLTVVVRAVRRGRGAERWLELSLAAAAAVAAGLGMLIPKLIARLGGFQVWHFQTHTMPVSKLPHDLWNVTQSVLEVFGANVFEPQSAVERVLVSVHFAGVLLALIAFAVAIARFLRWDTVVIPGLAVAIAVELGAYLISVHSSGLGSIREIVAVMPFGAVLAGRTAAGPLLQLLRGGLPPQQPRPVPGGLAPRQPQPVPGGLAPRQPQPIPGGLAAPRPRLAAALRPAALAVGAVVLAGYLGSLVYDATRPAIPSANQGLAGWLKAHHLSDGLAAYWQAGSITLDSANGWANGWAGPDVHVNSVIIARHDRIGPYYWEAKRSDFDPALHDATFLIAAGPKSVAPIAGLAQAAIHTFGPPTHTYHYQSYEILTWSHNILRQLP